jgi:uncharacterized protein YbbC (DUF1343 family)
MSQPIALGIENLAAGSPDKLRQARLGLLMNRASVDHQLRLSCDVLAEADIGRLTALFTPQHGLWGDAQANMIESDHGWHPRLGIPICSLYSETRRPTSEMLGDLDVFVIDLQDVGTRVYTYIWTMLECLWACADAGLPVVVLDRPNPLGGIIVEGPTLDLNYRSFVGGAAIPMRHGLTIGEMARLLNAQLDIGGELDVIPMTGWSPDLGYEDLGRIWIAPSPNLPRVQSAQVYPGQVLLEGSNLSEGRGTTTPFEIVGAPYVDAVTLQQAMASEDLPGVRFLPIQFRPTFDKWARDLCGGVSLHVTQPHVLRPYAMTMTLLSVVQDLWPDDFRWLDPPYEYETEISPIDIISGSDRLRTALTRDTVASLCEVDGEGWRNKVRPALLYDRPHALAD